MSVRCGACVCIIDTIDSSRALDSLDSGVVKRNVYVCVTVQREEVAVVEVVPPKVYLFGN